RPRVPRRWTAGWSGSCRPLDPLEHRTGGRVDRPLRVTDVRLDHAVEGGPLAALRPDLTVAEDGPAPPGLLTLPVRRQRAHVVGHLAAVDPDAGAGPFAGEADLDPR